MGTVIVTGSCGLVGSEAVRFYAGEGHVVVGIDNDMRASFFGPEGSTAWMRQKLEGEYSKYIHRNIDIRDSDAVDRVFSDHASNAEAIIHTAAQPSHDWAASDPCMDFSVNATGTLVLLEVARRRCPDAPFIHVSTNKVYGDTPNRLPLVELETRWELDESHPYYLHGIDEQMSVDQTKHSLFGASKLSGDVLAQEYGRYFGMNVGIFRGGCLTGPAHSGTQLHGFLSYLMKCAVSGREYTVFGYKGKQVRDNIHSRDLVRAFEEFRRNPRPGEVYNIGGGRYSNCSMNEAIAMCERIAGRKMKVCYSDDARIGDHVWWISSMEKFRNHYPAWTWTYDVEAILEEIYEACAGQLHGGNPS